MVVRQILVGLLVSLVLTASTGATIHQMVCTHSGNAEYSFNDIDCCKGDNGQERIKRTCCEFFSITYQTDDLVNTNSELNLNLVAVSVSEFKVSKNHFFLKKQTIPSQYNLPPPYKLPIFKEVQSFLC